MKEYNFELVAQATFYNVDGEKIVCEYHGSDVSRLLDLVGYEITDADNFPVPSNPIYHGINGTINILKPILINIFPVGASE